MTVDKVFSRDSQRGYSRGGRIRLRIPHMNISLFIGSRDSFQSFAERRSPKAWEWLKKCYTGRIVGFREVWKRFDAWCYVHYFRQVQIKEGHQPTLHIDFKEKYLIGPDGISVAVSVG